MRQVSSLQEGVWTYGNRSPLQGRQRNRGWHIGDSGHDMRDYQQSHGNIGLRGLGAKEMGEMGRYVMKRVYVDVRQQKFSPGQTT